MSFDEVSEMFKTAVKVGRCAEHHAPILGGSSDGAEVYRAPDGRRYQWRVYGPAPLHVACLVTLGGTLTACGYRPSQPEGWVLAPLGARRCLGCERLAAAMVIDGWR